MTLTIHRRSAHRVAVGLLTAASAVLYAACALTRYRAFRSGTYDLVIFDQAVRSYSRLQAPVSIAKGVHNGFGPDFAVLGDHFSPILALLAPLYRIHDGPQTLLVAQAVLFASAVVPLWLLTRRELGVVAAYCVGAGYALSWPVAQAVTFDFHEAAFLPVLTAWLFERLSAYWRTEAPWWHVALPAVGLLAVKEDTGLILIGLGLAVTLRAATLRAATPGAATLRAATPGAGAGTGRATGAGAAGVGGRVPGAVGLGAGLVVAGVLGSVFSTQVVIPAFGGEAGYYWRYSQLGPDAPSALAYVLRHPLDTASLVGQPVTKAYTLLWLLALAALLPLISPYLLVALLPLAERMLSDAPSWWGTDYHYNAAVVVPLLCAGVDGAARLRRRWPDRARYAGPVWAATVLVVAVFAVPYFGFGWLAEPSAWRGDADTRAAAAAIAQVPPGSLVEAANSLGPQLSGHARVLLWDREPRWAPWVVADVRVPQFPFCGVAEQRDRVAALKAAGYAVVFERHGFVVLHRPGPDPALPALRAPGCT